MTEKREFQLPNMDDPDWLEKPIESDAPWEDEEGYQPPAGVEYEISSEAEPEPVEEASEPSKMRVRRAGKGAETASEGLEGSGQGKGRTRLPKAPELDYGRDNGVGGIPWSRPCAWCGVIHGHTPAEQRARDRHYRYERTRSAGGIAPVKAHNYSTYVNWGCGCDACREANTEHTQRRAAARKAEGNADV